MSSCFEVAHECVLNMSLSLTFFYMHNYHFPIFFDRVGLTPYELRNMNITSKWPWFVRVQCSLRPCCMHSLAKRERWVTDELLKPTWAGLKIFSLPGWMSGELYCHTPGIPVGVSVCVHKNFHFGYNFWISINKAFIFHMCISCEQTFPDVP